MIYLIIFGRYTAIIFNCPEPFTFFPDPMASTSAVTQSCLPGSQVLPTVITFNTAMAASQDPLSLLEETFRERGSLWCSQAFAGLTSSIHSALQSGIQCLTHACLKVQRVKHAKDRRDRRNTALILSNGISVAIGSSTHQARCHQQQSFGTAGAQGLEPPAQRHQLEQLHQGSGRELGPFILWPMGSLSLASLDVSPQGYCYRVLAVVVFWV